MLHRNSARQGTMTVVSSSSLIEKRLRCVERVMYPIITYLILSAAACTFHVGVVNGEDLPYKRFHALYDGNEIEKQVCENN